MNNKEKHSPAKPEFFEWTPATTARFWDMVAHSPLKQFSFGAYAGRMPCARSKRMCRPTAAYWTLGQEMVMSSDFCWMKCSSSDLI